MGYRLVYSGSYESGKIITSVLDGSDLVKVLISSDTKRLKDGLPIWLSYIWEGKTERIDMTFNAYIIDPDKDVVEKEKDGKTRNLTEQHERILTLLLKELAGIPFDEEVN